METFSETEEMDVKEITAEVVITMTSAMKEGLLINTGNYS